MQKKIEDTRQERISLTKGIINRYSRLCDVIDMREMMLGMFSGIETIFVPACICEAYIPFILEKEAEILFQEKIKNMLEKKYGHALSYAQVGAPFSTMTNVSDLYVRNCYYYIAEDNQPVEIYVENISASLSAMVRVVTLVCELLGISLERRNCTVICLADSIRDIQLFVQMLKWVNKRYNANTNYKMPIYFLVYDDIKEGKLLSFDTVR